MCLSLDGPGVCIREQMSKMTDTVLNETLFCCGGYKEVNGTCVECDIGYYGQECRNKCICQSDQQCDQGTGNCSSIVNQTGNTSQKTEGFKFIVIAVILLAIVIITSACISLVIHFSRNRRVKYKTTDPIGHYGDMHHNDEIGPEEFQTLQEPFYSMPPHANSLMHPLHSIERNDRMRTTNSTDASNSKRGCKIFKCMSLPNLSSQRLQLEQDNEMKNINTRSCDQLTQQTLYLTDSDYLNPYCSLLKSAVSGSDYLNPYTTLLTTTDEGNLYEN
ncbi:Hypothetical predicted protein [Mytilus galloprovincialis]|uniref:Uncharacterized protein n=1 Tax=Mytilus galloprovincialis TaxID=29158 RepID=A0A8B6HBJ0_MYTGA|nr:Hypothetical predicted protein [Mytilus galloprovincialis]